MRKLFDKVPEIYFPCSGASEGMSELQAFDAALLEAGIGDTNLVRMSSIVPPSCQRVDPFRLPYGSLVPVAYASMTSSNPGEWIASAVACAIPEDGSRAGLIMEHHGVGRAEEIEAQVREMAIAGMKHRDRAIHRLVSLSAEHQVVKYGATFAGIVLWWRD
jgi:arginine decarboxylase